MRINWNGVNASFKIYRNILLNLVIKLLFISTLLLMPYDAIRIMPTIYKPICLIPACLLFLILVPKILACRLDKASILLIVFCIFSFVSTFINDMFNSFYNFMDYFFSVTLLFCSFFSINYIFKNMKKKMSTDDYKFFFYKVIAVAYILPTIIGVIDVLAVYGFFPFYIKKTICLIFGGNQLDRVTGVSFESSWLMCHLIISFCVYLYMYKMTRLKKYFIFLMCNIFVFFAALSLQGFMFIIIGVILYLLFNIRKVSKNTFIIIFIFGIACLVTLLIINQIDSDVYYIVRIKQFVSISQLFRTDLSTFVRTGYPLISIIMFIRNPILGIGGSNFGMHLGSYIDEFFPWALYFYGDSNNEVFYTVMSNSGNPKCFYTRVFCEFGFIAGVSIVLFLICIFRNKKVDKISSFYTIFILTFLLQFDSLCYALLILYAAFYNNIEKKQK